MKFPNISQWKQLGFTISIIIMLNLLISLGARVLFTEPEYPTDCRNRVVETEAACASQEGTWRAAERVPEAKDAAVLAPGGYCEKVKCEKVYQTDLSEYQRNIFLVSFLGGTLAIVLGLVLAIEVIAMGLLFGGVIQVFIATVGYWQAADELIRFVVVVAGFALLMMIGVKKYHHRS